MENWRRAWREGGLDSLRSAGLVSTKWLLAEQWVRLERELNAVRWRTAGTPVGSSQLVWVWDNLNVRLAGELTDFIAQRTNDAVVRTFQLPSYAPGLNSTEGVWSLV